MKKVSVTIFISVCFLVALYFLFGNGEESLSTSSFEECAKHFPVAESYPRQCIDSKGNRFIEDIGNILEKTELIRLENVYPNQEISSPLVIKGEARGFWFFEASFPIRLYDENNILIATSIVTSKDDWMTEEFVQFESEIIFETEAKKGYLVLEKDNPSGLEENNDELRIPILFKNN